MYSLLRQNKRLYPITEESMTDSQLKKEIHWVCYECGISANVLTCIKRYGKRPNKLHFTISTYHAGKCDVCERIQDEDGEDLFVTEPRDYFWPDFSLLP